MTDRISPRGARHRFGGWFRDRRWFSRTAPDKRPYFEISHFIQAKDMDEASALFEGMTDALGCSDYCDENHVCPHFRMGALHQLDDDE